jgi:hypothetical protein
MAYTPDRRRLITAQLPGRRGKPLIQCPGPLLRERPIQLLTLLLECPVQLLTLLRKRLLSISAGCTAAGNLHDHRSGHSKDDTADGDPRRGDLRAHKRNRRMVNGKVALMVPKLPVSYHLDGWEQARTSLSAA